MGNIFLEMTNKMIDEMNKLSESDKIETINMIKILLHDNSPFKNEPVDCVLWVDSEAVQANNYNPNIVAPPEMELLKLSIMEDGYTQPIVAFNENGQYTVVDGYHRNRVGKEDKIIKKRIKNYLPITIIKSERENFDDRIASTIRHNRARGKHTVNAMSNIVLELSRRNWSDEKISKKLGMDADEVLRLKQITGLADLFADKDFSEAWEV